MTVDRSPTRVSVGAALIAGFVALSSAIESNAALVVGGLGFLFLLVGTGQGWTRGVSFGAAGLLAGALGGGAAGAAVEAPILGTVGAIVAWDAGRTAIDVGEQLGREADTARLEFVHLAGTVGASLLAAGLGYTVYRLASGGKPVAAVVFLVLAAALIAVALR